MTRGAARTVHAATLLVGVTGLVLAWMRYLCSPSDEFALSNHPWEPEFKALHVVTAPLLVFALGIIWQGHVWARVRAWAGPRRPTGILLVVLVGPMIATGYLLQAAIDETWRTILIWTHVGSGIAWLGVYLAHQISSRNARQGA